MNDSSSQPRRLALVIDADNAQPSLIQPVLLAAASRGRVTVRRIYGDWTSPNMTSWKAHLLDHSIRPIQQFRIVGGKNATDSAMIIDAMDLLHSGLVDGFCIVSSDSDFTSLARRIQESGLFVMGVGRRTTPVAFQRACEEFVFTDDMRVAAGFGAEEETCGIVRQQRRAPRTDTAQAAQRAAGRADPRTAVAGHPVGHRRGQRLAGIGRVGQIVRQYEPGFSHKDYGHASLSGLLESHPELFRLRKGDNGQAQVQLIERAADKQLELLPEPAPDAAPEAATEAPAKSRRSRPQRKAKPAAETVTPAPTEAPAAAAQATVESTEAKPAKPRAPRRSRTRKPEGEAPQS